MRLAEDLGLPLVTVIDTPGAELSPAAEEGAIAREIARCIAALTTMTVPTVSVILGQGCGGGALALLPAQVVIAAQNAWLSPLPPEGASVIRYGDMDHAPEMAETQGIGAAALMESGIVHHVVPELPEDGPESLAIAVAATVANELGRLNQHAGDFSGREVPGSAGRRRARPPRRSRRDHRAG